jgi:hypothetical protein
MTPGLVFWIVTWILCGITTAVIADSKGRSAGAWAAIGFVCGIFAIIMILALPRLEPPTELQRHIYYSRPKPSNAAVDIPEIVLLVASVVVIVVLVTMALGMM